MIRILFFFLPSGKGESPKINPEPIAHLYKTQVYQLAEYLGVPEEIRKRTTTRYIHLPPLLVDEIPEIKNNY